MAAIVKTVGGLALASVKTFNGLAAASLKTINGQDATAAGGGGSSTFYDGITAGTDVWPIGETSTHYYAGLGNWTSDASGFIEKITVKLGLHAGSISGKTFHARVWTRSGDDLLVEVGTSDGVTGSNAWSLTNVEFPFSTPCARAAATAYHITLDMGGIDGSNYAGGYHHADTQSGNLAWWGSNLVSGTMLSGFDFQLAIYGT
jgi:hypothetical protein